MTNMDIVITDNAVLVNGDFISFRGKTHDAFLTAFLAVCGMTPEYLKEYKDNRNITGADNFTDSVLYVYQRVIALKANQKPLTDFAEIYGSDYYQRAVTDSKNVTTGSAVESMPTQGRQPSRRRK